MTDKKLKIGVFSSTLSSKNKRGANRLFHALYESLRARDDVEIYLLDERISYAAGQTETLFSFHRPYDEAKKEGGCLLFLNRLLHLSIRVRTLISYFRHGVIGRFPFPIRLLLFPFTLLASLSFRVVALLELRLQRAYTRLKGAGLSNPSFRDVLDRFLKEDRKDFSNKDIKTKTLNVRSLDVLLNFWWFHLPIGDETIHLAHPDGPAVYNWFLDAIPLRIPHWQEGFIAEDSFYEKVVPHCNSCDRLIAISDSAAEDATRFFGVKKEKISVVPCGIFEEDFFEEPPQRNQALFERLGLDPTLPLFLALGVQEPSKNTINILKALQKLSEKTDKPFQFACIGAHEGFAPEQRFGYVLDKLKGKIPVRFLGSLEEEDKRHLLACSEIFIYPSLWEGFGIPPLEAMAAGVPVLVSELASLPAVCQEHATYCNPYNIEDMAQKILEILAWPAQEKKDRLDKARTYAHGWLWKNKATEDLIALIQADKEQIS